MSEPVKQAPIGRTLQGAVYVLTVLTIVLLIGVFFFFASVSVWWQSAEPVLVVETAVSATSTSLPTATALTVDAVATKASVELATVEEDVEIDTAVDQLPVPSVSAPQPIEENLPALGELIIPDIEVQQAVIPIFIRDGQWDISQIGSEIGHLETTGAFPGDRLAMTFTGHVTLPWPEIVGPFADLIFLEHGEEIIYRWNGIDYVYEVERIFRADPQAVHLLYEEDGDKLILVTCSGWDASGRAYAERLVTRAVLVRQEPSPQNG